MRAAPSHRSISDDLLTVAIQIKREAGIDHAQIQSVIDRFASENHWHDRTGGIGFPLVEDVPVEDREAFLAALAALAPHPDRPAGRAASRSIPVTEIWPSRI